MIFDFCVNPKVFFQCLLQTLFIHPNYQTVNYTLLFNYPAKAIIIIGIYRQSDKAAW